MMIDIAEKEYKISIRKKRDTIVARCARRRWFLNNELPIE